MAQILRRESGRYNPEWYSVDCEDVCLLVARVEIHEQSSSRDLAKPVVMATPGHLRHWSDDLEDDGTSAGMI